TRRWPSYNQNKPTRNQPLHLQVESGAPHASAVHQSQVFSGFSQRNLEVDPESSGYIKDVSGKLIRSRSSSRQLNPLSSSLSFLSPAGNRRGSFCALNHSPE
ncbi:hypothetical protein PMS72_09475, partial [Bifidobacterium longum]|nr:hypothetical protein [Bifidobacterium longum]